MKIFYFTSTGNNLYIAKQLGGQLYSIPKLLKEGPLEFEDDKIGIVFPCYYLGTPRLIKTFLEKVTLKSDYIFAIMSYGNFSGGGTDHFLQCARNAGMKLAYLNEILMIDNYFPMFDIESQRENASKKEIESHLAQIVSDIQAGKQFIREQGIFRRMATLAMQSYYKRHLRNVDSRFVIEDSCNSCKICEKVCSVDNIAVNGKPIYLHHCEECLACAHHCPQNAIRVRNEKSSARFINEHVSVQEIIASHTS